MTVQLAENKYSCFNCVNSNCCISSCFDGGEQVTFFDKIYNKQIFHKQDLLFSQGNKCSSVYILQSGSAKSYVTSANGEEQIFSFHFAGDLIGLGGIENDRHSCSTEVLDTSSVCEILLPDFCSLLASNSTTSRLFLNRISHLCSSEAQSMFRLGKMTAEQKLASFILDMSKNTSRNNHSEKDLNLPMSRRDIANYLGLALETVSRLLTRFQCHSLIEVYRRRILILNKAYLQSMIIEDLTLDELGNKVA